MLEKIIMLGKDRLKKSIVSASKKPFDNLLPIQKSRIELGPINIVVLGETNSGKSTLINALSGKIVVSEKTHSSTMLITYIGCKENTNIAQIYSTTEGKLIEEIPVIEFKNKYSYQSPYENRLNKQILEAHISIGNSLINTGCCLVDTLGINACESDTIETEKSITNADVIIYVIDTHKTQSLSSSDRQFIETYIFPKKEKGVDPNKVIIALNKCDPNDDSFKQKVRNFSQSMLSFFSLGSPEYKTLQKNIVPISALLARIHIVGFYDYNQEVKSKEIVNDLIKFEKQILFSSTLPIEQSGINTLKDRIEDALAHIIIDFHELIKKKLITYSVSSSAAAADQKEKIANGVSSGKNEPKSNGSYCVENLCKINRSINISRRWNNYINNIDNYPFYMSILKSEKGENGIISVIGKITSGTVKTKSILQLHGLLTSEQYAKVERVIRHNNYPEDITLYISGIPMYMIKPGMVLTTYNETRVCKEISADIKLLSDNEWDERIPISHLFNNSHVLINLNKIEIPAIIFTNKDIMQGEIAKVKFVLNKSTPNFIGQFFTIKLFSITIAIGQIIE